MEALPLFIQNDNKVTRQCGDKREIFSEVTQGSFCKAEPAAVAVTYLNTHGALAYGGLEVAGYLESLVAPGTSNEGIRDRDIGADHHAK